MATTVNEVVHTGHSLDLEELVKKATWREFLMGLVESSQLDPWDIDISKIVDGYMTAIKAMQIMDLSIPANIILAASILLKMKSDMVGLASIEEPAQVTDEAQAERIIPSVQPLSLRSRVQPSRKVTLDELLDALDEAMKVQQHREYRMELENTPVPMLIKVDDIDQKLDRTLSMVRDNADATGMVTFAALANKFNYAESMLLDLFVPLLFLAHKGNVLLFQEEFFNEIFIKLGSGDADAGSRTA
jgi:segregation and condensation protein A